MNKEEKFCGFVWFIIPKVILNLKITYRAAQLSMMELENEEYLEKAEDEEEEEYI